MALGRLVCDLCDREFDRLGLLIRHRERRHRLTPSEARFNPVLLLRWVCPECETTFTQSSSFYRHLRRQHDIEPVADDDDDDEEDDDD